MHNCREVVDCSLDAAAGATDFDEIYGDQRAFQGVYGFAIVCQQNIVFLLDKIRKLFMFVAEHKELLLCKTMLLCQNDLVIDIVINRK